MMIPKEACRNTLPDAWHRAVRARPDKTALQYQNRNWSFFELQQAACRVANRLLEEGLCAGDRLAVYGKNSDAYLITYLACLEAGFIHVPVNYGLVGEELAYILTQSGSRALFYDVALADKAESVCTEGPLADQISVLGSLYEGDGLDILQVAINEGDTLLPERDISPDDCVQIMYTSGTTSLPKGAIMTHSCLLAEYASCMVHLNFSESQKALAALPLYHTAQMHVFTFPMLLIGGSTLLINSPEPSTVCRLIETHGIDSFFAPPTVWINLLRSEAFGQYNLSSLTRIYYGASIMPEPIVLELMERLPQAGIYNCYGQTELSPLATVLGPEGHKIKPSSAGKPVINVETRVVDENMKDVCPGERGEIVHRSPQLMRGYWNKPEETEASFTDGWFHSGDLGVMDEDGYLFVVDRVKDVINTGGVLVASRDVEEALYKYEAVAEVAVIGVPDDKWIEAIAAFVVLKPGRQTDEEVLVEFARQHLAHYKVPKQVRFVDELPKNASGKVLKRALRERDVC